MSRNWREIEAEKQPNDSLELGDSWKGMPRRADGVANKTNGLYRRSVMPPQNQKNIYELIIQPIDNVEKETNLNPANGAAATQSQITLIPCVKPISSDDADDTFNFKKFLNMENKEVATSTPYPLRHIDVNKTPKRGTTKVQRRKADSPRKPFLQLPTRIPVSTPRSSRIPSKSEQGAPDKLRRETNENKMSSSLVSSTVLSDEGEVESDPVKSTEEPVQSERTSPTTENAEQNCVPFDEDRQEQDVSRKPSDEELFRRPELVRRPSEKPSKLNSENASASNQSESSTTSQRNKQPKKVNALLESYIKVGETINKTNGVPSDNSTSSSRRRLYRKADSCTEDEINRHLNSVPAVENATISAKLPVLVRPNRGETDIQMDTTESNQNVDKPTVPLKTTTDCQPELTLQNLMKILDDENVENEIEDLTSSDPLSPANEFVNDEPNQHSRTQKGEAASTNSIDQQNPMSKEHSSKQVLERILEDWSEQQNESENGRPECIDSGQSIQHNNEKQPPIGSKVRQVRSENQINRKVDVPSSRNPATQPTRANTQGKATEENQLSNQVRTSKDSENSSVAKKTDKMEKKVVLKKSKPVPAKSNQQHEDICDDLLGSTENEPMPDESARSLRKKNEHVHYVEDVRPWKSARPKKRPIENDTTKSQVKAKKKRLNVEKDATESNDETDNNEVELPTKPQGKTKSKRGNVTKDATERNAENGGTNEVELPTKPQGKTKSKRGNVTKDATERNAENGGTNEVELPTKPQEKAKSKRGNVTKDATERNAENGGTNEVELPTKPQRKTKSKRGNVTKDATERNAENGGTNEVELPTKPQEKAKSKRGNVTKDATERNAENGGTNEVELPTKPQVKAKSNRGNVTKDATERNAENGGTNEVELPTKPQVKAKIKRGNVEDGNGVELPKKSKTKKKRLNVEEDAIETMAVDTPAIEIDDNLDQHHTDGNANEIQSSKKSKSLQTRQQKKHADVEAKSQTYASNTGNGEEESQMSASNASVKRKTKRLSKWERPRNFSSYVALQRREMAPGIRHSSRERRAPENHLLSLLKIPKRAANQSALKNSDSNVAPRRRHIQPNDSQNVYSMLLDGSVDKEPPLITNLHGIELTQGFHRSVSNALVIHHIPGETGPSYGYFTLEPGMVKRACRISWNLHLHVVSGTVVIITEDESETMKTGAFAAIDHGMKYSLRNDGENSALIFFNQTSPQIR